jgi:hypothetical protein
LHLHIRVHPQPEILSPTNACLVHGHIDTQHAFEAALNLLSQTAKPIGSVEYN